MIQYYTIGNLVFIAVTHRITFIYIVTKFVFNDTQRKTLIL